MLCENLKLSSSINHTMQNLINSLSAFALGDRRSWMCDAGAGWMRVRRAWGESLGDDARREMLKDQDEGALQGPGGYEACYGCGGRIKDRFFLLAVDEQWHSGCLKCCECKTPLGPDGSCFVKENNIYCKKDYYRSEQILVCVIPKTYSR